MPYCLGLGCAMGFRHEKQEWRKERSSDWYDRIVLQTFTDEQWLENFRMTRQTFNKACRVLKPGKYCAGCNRCAETNNTHDLLVCHSN